MNEKTKYYHILGLREGASQIEIKNNYKNLVLIYHPDLNKETGSHKKMQEINEAKDALFNQILYDKEMRDLKKDPKAYYEARANYPIVFEEEGENDGQENSSKQTSNYGKNNSSTAVKPYVSKPKTPPTSKPKQPVTKKKNESSGLVPFCIGGALVAAIFALFSFPPLLLIIIIGVVAYLLFK